jgi:hypothetical protein
MSATHSEKPRKLTSLELPRPARRALKRMKRRHGITQTAAISRGVALLEKTLEGVV